MKVASLALILAVADAFVPPANVAVHKSVVMSEAAAPAEENDVKFAAKLSGGADKAALIQLQSELNPVIPFWDPLGLADLDFWDQGSEATIGFLRHSEIKHGRVAMAAFVGYIAQSNGWRFPFPIQYDGTGFPASSLSPPEQLDALSLQAKMQIGFFIGCLEFFGEYTATTSLGEGTGANTHYMRGGMPGKYPSWDGWLFQLFDPFGLSKSRSEEKKASGRLAEINNGRLAMIGIFGFLAESKTPGAVPFLSAMQGTASEIKPYAGDYMAPFSTNFGMGFHDLVDPFI